MVVPRDMRRDQKSPTKGKPRSSKAPDSTIEGTTIPEAIKKPKELASLGDAVLPTKTLLSDPQVAVTVVATATVPGVHVGSVSAGSLTGSSSQSALAYKPPLSMPGARSATAHDAALTLARAQARHGLGVPTGKISHRITDFSGDVYGNFDTAFDRF